MTYRVFFTKLNFQRTDPANPSVPIGDPVLVGRGEKVPDWVSPGQVNALLNAGMIVNTGDEGEVPAYLRPESEIPPQPRTPDQPDILPSDPNGGLLVLDGTVPPGEGTFPDEPAPATSDPVVVDRPSERDSKDEWEAYAVSVGVPQSEAEAMTKAKLIDEVKRREAGTTTA